SGRTGTIGGLCEGAGGLWEGRAPSAAGSGGGPAPRDGPARVDAGPGRPGELRLCLPGLSRAAPLSPSGAECRARRPDVGAVRADPGGGAPPGGDTQREGSGGRRWLQRVDGRARGGTDRAETAAGGAGGGEPGG